MPRLKPRRISRREPRGNPRKQVRWRRARVPGRGRAFIYRSALLLGTVKGRHRNGDLFLHSFDKGIRCRVYGLPDGSIQIKPHWGRMWKTFEG